MTDDGGEIVAMGNLKILIYVCSSRALAGHVLLPAHLDNLHDRASLKALPQARQRYGLRRPKSNE
jgi:hypothetical protein